MLTTRFAHSASALDKHIAKSRFLLTLTTVGVALHVGATPSSFPKQWESPRSIPPRYSEPQAHTHGHMYLSVFTVYFILPLATFNCTPPQPPRRPLNRPPPWPLLRYPALTPPRARLPSTAPLTFPPLCLLAHGLTVHQK